MLNDIKMHYIEKGTGFPLVLLHGNGDSCEYFSPQIEYFSRYYRVIAVDTRGHGGTPRGRKPFTLDQFADDLELFFDELGIKRAHLLGFSDGGNIAMLFAMRYHERVVKLILCGANTEPCGLRPSVTAHILGDYAKTFTSSPFSLQTKRKRELLRLMIDEPHIPDEELGWIDAPTLVIAGNRDMIKYSHTRHIAEKLPNAVLRILDGTHFVSSENSVAFNSAVHEFLK